ncbi:MAG: hypothetical protein Q9166_000313 [cf. Caloplaca sp. 2 TL-2023]
MAERGRSKEPTAGSFVRPNSKLIDSQRQLLSAVIEKYGSENEARSTITISGKEVDEVGFDAISKKQSAWTELTTVSLDGLRIDSRYQEPLRSEQDYQCIQQVLPRGLKWRELDLSRNLFDEWNDIKNVCTFLPELRVLKVNGNRFLDIRSEHGEMDDTFKRLETLSLADTAVNWDDIITLCTQRRFPNLQCLNLAFNPLKDPPNLNLSLPNITTIDLTSCNLHNIFPLSFLSRLPALCTLILRSNPLATLTTSPPLTFPHLTTLDLTSTLLPTLSSLNPIPPTFPSLTSLKTTFTPLTATHPSPRLMTIAHLPGITILNNTPISTHERQDAELYYLNSIITPLILAAENAAQEATIVDEHPQLRPLCEKYGEPESITLKYHPHSSSSTTPPTPLNPANNGNDKPIYPPLSLGASLILFTFTFHSPSPSPSLLPSTRTLVKEIPKQIDIYRLKAIVGRAFGLPAMGARLVLETDEWDPVLAGRPEEGDWSCSEDEWSDEISEGGEERVKEMEGKRERKEKGMGKGLWVRREIELVDSTRPVSFWIEGKEAMVRVEKRDLSLFQ